MKIMKMNNIQGRKSETPWSTHSPYSAVLRCTPFVLQSYSKFRSHAFSPLITSNNIETTFQGIRIFDKINPTNSAHYFQIFINNKQKYVYKQTAVHRLNSTKNSLSTEKLLRVQQINKQQ
jgi:hypothetical protein